MTDNLFLSVGAMKAGTTWLYSQLRHHPEIYFTPEKEIHYFANKVGIEKQLNRKSRVEKLSYHIDKVKGGNLKFLSECTEELAWYSLFANEVDINNDWYERLFILNDDKKYCADFSNLYCLMGSDGWKNVRKVAKNTKVIYTLRDPFKRLWSHYKFHQKFIGNENQTLEASLEEFKELLDKDFFWRNAEYADNYLRLKENLKDDELMVLYMEDTIEKPLESLTKIQEFLGINIILPDEGKLGNKVNATKDFKPPDEWKEIMVSKLRPEIDKMKEVGLWHENWGV